MWLETVVVRPAQHQKTALREYLDQWQAQLADSPEPVQCEVFFRLPAGTDTAIHIRHHTGSSFPAANPLGLRLAENLREFGPVKRSLWAPHSF